MSVSVAGLRPPFATEFTLEGLFLSVESQVVVKTAQLLELFLTDFARKNLVHSLGDAVARVRDGVVFELTHLEAVRALHLLSAVAAREALHGCHEFDRTLKVLGALGFHVATIIREDWWFIFRVEFARIRTTWNLKFDRERLSVGCWII